MKLEKTNDGVVMDIHVKPNSKQFGVAVESDEVIVLCRAAPTKGKANRELTKELSRLFKKRVDILSGFSSRQKKIFIRDIEKSKVKKILDAAALHKLTG